MHTLKAKYRAQDCWRMQILWLNHRDPKHPLAGGSELHLIEVGKRLVHQGHTVDVVCEKAPKFTCSPL
jgi:hypothetical protein